MRKARQYYVYLMIARQGIYLNKRVLDVAKRIVAYDPVLEPVYPGSDATYDMA